MRLQDGRYNTPKPITLLAIDVIRRISYYVGVLEDKRRSIYFDSFSANPLHEPRLCCLVNLTSGFNASHEEQTDRKWIQYTRQYFDDS